MVIVGGEESVSHRIPQCGAIYGEVATVDSSAKRLNGVPHTPRTNLSSGYHRAVDDRSATRDCSDADLGV